MRPESEFPTIRDARDMLSELVDRGLGELPVQILIVPASTLHALAGKNAKMLEMYPAGGSGIGVLIASVDTMRGASRFGVQ